MYIVSINENLLERLKLSVQQDCFDSGKIDDLPNFIACLANERYLCGPSEKFIILIGKDWDKTSIDMISDITRHIMSMNNNGKMLIIKKEMNDNDNKELEILINNIHNNWISEWKHQSNKINKLGDSKSKSETLKKIENWINPIKPKYSLIDFDDNLINDKIINYFSLNNIINIVDYTSLNLPKLINKPPALHWTHYPREAEIQISFKFNFPKGTIHEKLFRTIIDDVRNCFQWEYSYEWINGILFKEDFIKITVIRSDHHIIEICGRIDKDEVVEDDITLPFRPVWPYLADVFKVVYHRLENYQLLPYMLNIIFIGDIFFEKSNCNSADVEENSLNARSLDAAQTLGAIERVKAVKFKIGNLIYSLDLKQAFPDFEPKVLSDFWIQNANKPKHKKIEILQSPKISTVDSPPVYPSHGMNSLNVHKNRGRRVSFGGIRDIPTTSAPTLLRTGSNNAIEIPSESFKNLNIPETSDTNENEKITENHHETPSSPNSLSEYVDNIVQKTIDEVLVLE